jgi:hypothetical protein
MLTMLLEASRLACNGGSLLDVDYIHQLPEGYIYKVAGLVSLATQWVYNM